MNTAPNAADLRDLIATRIRADVRAMHAYAVQDAAGMVKLDAMENPYSLPPELQAKLGQRLAALPLNRYPSTEPLALQQALRRYAGVPDSCGLILGNGSDELITLLNVACAQPGASVIAPMPGFVMYALSAQLAGLRFVGVPLQADFELDEAAMLTAIEQERPAIVWLAYPNNPTAHAWSRTSMARIIAAAAAVQAIVVIDEAYQPFAQHSWWSEWQAAPQLHQHVLVMRTLSKFGLAGIRLGYLMGAADLVHEVDKVRPPYNSNLLTVETALFALEHEAEFATQAAAIRSEREGLLSALAQLPSVQVFPSQANMILLRLPEAAGGSAAAFAALKAQGILVKNVAAMHPLLTNCLRLTVGTPAENAKMLAALQAFLA
ncbi:MAG: histidinol-phosphate transaminase [Brachymonas sp.]